MSWRRVAQSVERLGAADKPPWPEGEEGEPSMMDPDPQRSARPVFRLIHPLWMAWIAAGLGYFGWVVFSPATIPYDCLGPLGTLTHYLVENHKAYLNIGYAIAWLIHFIEMLYALKLCREKGITDRSTQLLWTIQTFLFGFPSLNILLKYDLLKERKHQ